MSRPRVCRQAVVGADGRRAFRCSRRQTAGGCGRCAPASPGSADESQRFLHASLGSVNDSRVRTTALPGGDHRSCRVIRQRVTRIDGPHRCVWRQCRDGVVLRSAATQRSGPATVGHPGGVAVGDRHLDRADLPPTAPATRPGKALPERVRTAPHARRNRGLMFTPHKSTKAGAVPAVV